MMYRMLVFAIISCFISITTYSQNIPSSKNHEFEAHGKSAYNTAVALSKRAQFTIPEAENYDVKHYDINVRIVINVMTFSGSTAMTIESLTDGLDTVKYDFHERGVVDSVFVNGVLTPHTHIGDIVAVGLDAPLGTGESATIRTVYRYMFPSDALIVKGVTNQNLGKSTYSIASHVEPYDARKWWPCKDDPADKADSVDITITTNSYLEVVSNGAFVSDTPLEDGLHATHWKTRYPIATYLVSIALSEYSKNEYTWNYENISMPVTTWYFRENDEDVQDADDAVLEGLTIFSDLFGMYPFYEEKYGMAEYVWGGAMEHQTITSMGAFYADIAIHELAHQWFGDKVTCATFEHIWLNEGWATYCESLYYEMKYGVQARNSNLSYNKYFGPGTIYVDDPENKDKSEIFSGDLSYNKSSWVVHMLRGVVGDSAFFRATRNYLGDLRKENYRSVTTAEFQEYYETESGMDLDFFFDEWIYGEYYPAYSFGFDTTPEQDKYRTTVSIEQVNVPEHQIFTMPIQLLFRFAQFDSTVTIWNDTQAATYQFVFDAAPVSVTLDPNNWILKQVEIPQKPLVNPDFKNTVLLVNGVEWSDGYYGDLLRDSFANESYTADYPYVYYDLYPFPSGGYPETLPPPAGSSAIPLEELEKFCTVVWLGGADATDVVKLGETRLLEYVQRGGNLIMMPMMAGYYLQPAIQSYLGVGWYGNPISYFAECDAAQPYLIDMTPTITQYPVSVMNMTSSSPYNEVLFTDDITHGEQVALGIWNKPHSTEFGMSGNFILLSMMGYGMDQTGLRYNMGALLDSIMCNKTVGIVRPQSPASLQLQQNYPNPAHDATTFTYTIGTGNGIQPVTLKIYDYLGRVVSQPLTATRTPGTYSIRVSTEALPKGTYRVRLSTANASVWQSMIVAR